MTTTTGTTTRTYPDDHPFSPRFKSDLFPKSNRHPPPRNNVFAKAATHASKGAAPAMTKAAA